MLLFKSNIYYLIKLIQLTYYLEEDLYMAKKSKIAKFQRQQALIVKYAPLRAELKAKGDYDALRQLPRDANPNRLKNRDQLDGRPRAYMRQFGMSRINFRQYAHLGQIPGVRKASW
ncbi:hypothetical protein FC83_GL001626 [Agrilactobacillus composti DSM 18527 = JCM 14202]|uniref:Small ribosomal subunit protein uS14 n=2 Tax=Agrilactobacillus TaxID=2767875 RepID=A0A0R1XL67_9LACO|nr:hypothetical protein FC83_GL001626 [Agrilactobacillus composti DSM 18527 = JCM 14202]